MAAWFGLAASADRAAAQQQAGVGAAGTGAGATGAPVQGSGSGLSDRFQSNFSMTAGDTTAATSNVVGAAAATSGIFGAQATGNQAGGAQRGAGGLGLLGGLGGFGGFGGFGGRGGGGGQFGQTQNQLGNTTQQQQIPTRLVVGFAPRPFAPTAVSSQLARRLLRVQSRISGDEAPPISVAMDGRTAVLRGAVDSQHAIDLAVLLAKMEPGVSDVRNELTVRPASPATPGPADSPPPPEIPLR